MTLIEKVVFVRPVQLPGKSVLLRDRVTRVDCRIEHHAAGVLLEGDTGWTVVPWGNIVEVRTVIEPAAEPDVTEPPKATRKRR